MMRRVFCFGRQIMSKQSSDEKLAVLQKLRIALSGAGVEQAVADRHVQLLERLQSDESLLPRNACNREELITLLRGMKGPRKGDVVAEMAASVLRVKGSP